MSELLNKCAKIRKYLWYRIKGKVRIKNTDSARSQIPVISGLYMFLRNQYIKSDKNTRDLSYEIWFGLMTIFIVVVPLLKTKELTTTKEIFLYYEKW